MVRKRVGERFVNFNQGIRDKLFKFLLKLLSNFNISANYLSNLKIILFFPFFYFAFYNNLKISYIFLLISILIDIFDGPLARFQNKSSDQGKFIDIFGDLFIYLSVILTLFYLKIFNNYLVAFHLVVFPLVMILSTIRKQEFTKSDWIIKPAPELGQFNAAVYLFLFLYIYFNINYFNFVLLLINVFYTLLIIYYFIFIQFRWLKK